MKEVEFYAILATTAKPDTTYVLPSGTYRVQKAFCINNAAPGVDCNITLSAHGETLGVFPYQPDVHREP